MKDILVHHLKEQRLVGRNSFIVAFFTAGAYQRLGSRLREVLALWLETIPAEGAELGQVGYTSSSELKPFNKRLLNRAQLELDFSTDREGISVELIGGPSQCPGFLFQVTGASEEELGPDDNSLFELRFPASFAAELGYGRVAELVYETGKRIGYTSGYASPSLMLHPPAMNMALQRAGGKQLLPVLERHPGYDVSDNMCLRLGTASCRGPGWLTLLGNDLVKRLGGKKALQAKLHRTARAQPCGDGLLIRAGAEPELGDLDEGQHPEVLRSVARALEPVSQLQEPRLLQGFYPPSKVERESLRWRRRFLD